MLHSRPSNVRDRKSRVLSAGSRQRKTAFWARFRDRRRLCSGHGFATENCVLGAVSRQKKSRSKHGFATEKTRSERGFAAEKIRSGRGFAQEKMFWALYELSNVTWTTEVRFGKSDEVKFYRHFGKSGKSVADTWIIPANPRR